MWYDVSFQLGLPMLNSIPSLPSRGRCVRGQNILCAPPYSLHARTFLSSTGHASWPQTVSHLGGRQDWGCHSHMTTLLMDIGRYYTIVVLYLKDCSYFTKYLQGSFPVGSFSMPLTRMGSVQGPRGLPEWLTVM